MERNERIARLKRHRRERERGWIRVIRKRRKKRGMIQELRNTRLAGRGIIIIVKNRDTKQLLSTLK